MSSSELKRHIVSCLSICFSGVVLLAAQQAGSQNALPEIARKEYLSGNFRAAERSLRELTKIEPSNLQAHFYLGHALFYQKKYSEAAAPYEKVRELARTGQSLTQTEKRVLVDQLVMSYGISGQMKRAHALLDEAISQDPDYPLNYYNRACAFAEEGEKSKALENLELAFERKANIIGSEKMPDPRSDSSFQKYIRDPDFLSLMKKIGYP